MKDSNTRYYVTSPDGFAIERDASYPTPKAAWAVFELWKKGYEQKGYYSTVRNGQRIKIPLQELRSECELKEFNPNEK